MGKVKEFDFLDEFLEDFFVVMKLVEECDLVV